MCEDFGLVERGRKKKGKEGDSGTMYFTEAPTCSGPRVSRVQVMATGSIEQMRKIPESLPEIRCSFAKLVV